MKIERLLFVAAHAPSLRVDALRLVLVFFSWLKHHCKFI